MVMSCNYLIYLIFFNNVRITPESENTMSRLIAVASVAAITLGKRRFNQFLRNVEAQCAFFVHGMRNRPIFSLFTSIF